MHAARTACWRKRRRSLRHAGATIDVDKVTHQGCPRSSVDASLLACDTPSASELTALSESAAHAQPQPAHALSLRGLVCRRCAHSLLPHVRVGWLRARSIHRRAHHDHPS